MVKCKIGLKSYEGDCVVPPTKNQKQVALLFQTATLNKIIRNVNLKSKFQKESPGLYQAVREELKKRNSRKPKKVKPYKVAAFKDWY